MTAQTVTVRGTSFVIDVPDLVGGMALHTGRDHVRLFLPEPAFDDLPVYLFDLSMTLSACRSDVVLVDARPGIGMGQDQVGVVA